jgi:hypothetical protein
MPATAEGGKGVLALFVGLRADDHSAGHANEKRVVCREEARCQSFATGAVARRWRSSAA